MNPWRALRRLWLALRGDDTSRFRAAEVLTRLAYPRYRFSEYGRICLDDPAFAREYVRLTEPDDRSFDRKYLLDQLLQLVPPLEGDTAECGAYRGASSWFICRRLQGSGKVHHIFDSFEGLSEPGPLDGTHWKRGSLAGPEDVVRATLRSFPDVVYHKGWIPERFSEVSDRKFCFVHLDVDLHQPTLDSAAFFYPRVVPGGLILCDDYGFTTCPGARKALDEFFADKPEPVLSLPTGQGLVFKR
ncbi:MAG: class I SAM-dependent methyltransferase [Planctomycetes bacterium]|nr:class I SAM-dependent methyltransferase [Planctomycetota bacterium]